MSEIIRNFNGTKVIFQLTPDEIKAIIAEYATITVKQTAVPEPVPEPEPEVFKPARVIRTGCFTSHRDEVQQMLKQGWTYSQIGQYFGVNITTVGKYARVWGLNGLSQHKNAHKGLTIDDGKRMLELFRSGATLTKLANLYKCADVTILRWIKKAQELEGHTAA